MASNFEVDARGRSEVARRKDQGVSELGAGRPQNAAPSRDEASHEHGQIQVRKLKRDHTLVTTVKRSRAQSDEHCCEVCGWVPPVVGFYKGLQCKYRRARLLHLHHIVPLRWGGKDEEDNLILLCPNHHAVAHAIIGLWRSADGIAVSYDRLFAALRAISKAPNDWIYRFDSETGVLRRADPMPPYVPEYSRPADVERRVVLKHLAEFSALGGKVAKAGHRRTGPRKRVLRPFVPFGPERDWLRLLPINEG